MADSEVPEYVAPNAAIGDYVSVGAAPNFRYDPDNELPNNAYQEADSRGEWGRWAPELEHSTLGTPDKRRNLEIPLHQTYPSPNAPPENWYLRRFGEFLRRHTSVETVDGDGWHSQRGNMSRKRAAPDVRRTPPAESRVTSDLAPTTYSYTRPFDQTIARHMTGNHFSMADHRRTYEVYGMAPVYSRRNTYRADPVPWDTDIVDLPVPWDETSSRIRQIDVPDAAGRAWRL